jgi:hypothetical protein
MITRFLTISTILAAALGGCGSEPADVAGNYSVAVTNGANGCDFANWTEGETTANIPVLVTQEGTQVTAEVQGIVGGLLLLWLGASVYVGEIDGNSLELTLYGSNSTAVGNCTYTINSTMTAEFDKDVLRGQIHYRSATNGNPDCAGIEGCVTVQEFNGNRPPQ